MAITLPDLSYETDALAPHISENTIQFHDYQHKRPDYLSTFLEHLVNWECVNSLI